ncbi:MAG: hypothetical protein R2864_06605 [Syntrophotaleaceae bacterium]
MKLKTASHHRRWVLRLFEWAVLVSVVLLLIGVFLQRIEQLQVEAERLAFEGVVNSLNAAVMLCSISKNKAGEVSAGDNPMRLLDQVPLNYIGVFDDPYPEGLAGGHWVFHRGQRLLIYRTKQYRRAVSAFGDDRVRQFRLGEVASGKQKVKQFRLEVVEGLK